MENIGSVITYISAIASAFTAVISVIIAFFSLKKSNEAIAKNNDARKVSEKISEVMMVLEIESQMNERKSAWDESTLNMVKAEKKGESEDIMEVIISYHKTTKENYFNALDRMCFCVLKGYLEEKDWKTEYRSLLQNTIKECEGDFGEASPYRNIKKLNNKWQSE